MKPIIALIAGFLVALLLLMGTGAEAGTTYTAESIMREARWNSFGGGGYAVWYMPRYHNGQDLGVVAMWDMVGSQSFTARYYICLRDFSWDCDRW